MEGKTVFERLKDIISEQFGVPPGLVTPEAVFINGRELHLDSLDLVELVMAVEEEFQLEIPDDDGDKIKTVGDAVKYLEERIQTS